jgi:hypothetical protein
MKAGIIFTVSGPILILKSYDSFTNKDIVDKLKAKGIKKWVLQRIMSNKIITAGNQLSE